MNQAQNNYWIDVWLKQSQKVNDELVVKTHDWKSLKGFLTHFLKENPTHPSSITSDKIKEFLNQIYILYLELQCTK